MARVRCPGQTHLQANTFCLSVHSPSGSTGLLTELPTFSLRAQGLAGDTSHALAEHIQPWSPAPGAGPIHTTQTGASWRPSNLAKGHSHKLAAHGGYFGQGTAICQGWKQRSLHMSSQAPALLRSPLGRPQELTCPPAGIGMSCPRAHLLTGRQGVKLSSLKEETKGQCHVLPHHSTQPRKHPCHPGQEVSTQPVSHHGLAAAPSICSPKVSPPIDSPTSSTTHLC